MAGEQGVAGEQGLQGVQGEEGPQGEPGNLALAGLACSEGEYLIGFDAQGGLRCVALDAPPGDEEPPDEEEPPGPVDADADGFRPPQDCDDTDSDIRPGAQAVSTASTTTVTARSTRASGRARPARSRTARPVRGTPGVPAWRPDALGHRDPVLRGSRPC